jgi:hypothetical protein
VALKSGVRSDPPQYLGLRRGVAIRQILQHDLALHLRLMTADERDLVLGGKGDVDETLEDDAQQPTRAETRGSSDATR